ncbi:DNA methyltransferase [Erysipelothrix rhusiopathiae]|nr:DNA methyltransferase [Erysipelothrix rhusiopathiae]MDE8143756.1 DNA methyltransferase [Erysipelothrix rhusiopathiae]MDE8287930.1 DNA methyltransferase [Erysipelothrix rhusiopathiae]
MIKDNKNYNEKVKPNTEFLNELKSKLPQFFINEKYDEEGNLVSEGFFDIERFQESLRENNINEIKEGYQLSFIGKDYAKKQAGEKPTTVVVPDNEHNQEKINKNSKNLFFTGDNLEVLRHLQNNYRNSIDVIYIDPPYNTGNDGFIYPDSFEYSDEVLQDVFGLNENELNKLKSIQGKSTHSAWLTFMYPRLVLAKKILTDKGVLFVSTDDSEYVNLRGVCNEIFGEINNIANLIWKSKSGGANDSQHFAIDHEYISVYAKNSLFTELLPDYGATSTTSYNQVDEKGEYSLERLDKQSIRYSQSLDYEIIDNEGNKYFPKHKDVSNPNATWRWSKKTVKERFSELVFKNGNVYTKNYKTAGSVPRSLLIEERFGRTRTGKTQLEKLIPITKVFDNPKPTLLIKHFIGLVSKGDELILDFFAGSATTADAVMQLNAEDGGNRQFIMVQLDEPTYIETDRNARVARKGSEPAFNAGYISIDEISRERIKRASQKIREEKGLTLPKNFDGGFKHYRVVKPTQASINDLETYDPNTGMFVDSKGMPVAFSESGFDDMIQPFSSEGLGVSGDATGVDTILTTWMIQDGYKLDNEVHQLEIDGYNVFYVEPTRIYLIDNNWNSNNTKMLLNKIGNYDLNVQTVVIYGYSFVLESIRELELGLKQLPNKVNLVKRY